MRTWEHENITLSKALLNNALALQCLNVLMLKCSNEDIMYN